MARDIKAYVIDEKALIGLNNFNQDAATVDAALAAIVLTNEEAFSDYDKETLIEAVRTLLGGEGLFVQDLDALTFESAFEFVCSHY